MVNQHRPAPATIALVPSHDFRPVERGFQLSNNPRFVYGTQGRKQPQRHPDGTHVSSNAAGYSSVPEVCVGGRHVPISSAEILVSDQRLSCDMHEKCCRFNHCRSTKVIHCAPLKYPPALIPFQLEGSRSTYAHPMQNAFALVLGPTP